MKVIAIQDAKTFVPVTESYGGYTVQQCRLCGANGWSAGVDGIGLSPDSIAFHTQLRHNPECQIGLALDSDGRTITDLIDVGEI